MKIENILERFSCIAFLFKPPCMYENLSSWTKNSNTFHVVPLVLTRILKLKNMQVVKP